MNALIPLRRLRCAVTAAVAISGAILGGAEQGPASLCAGAAAPAAAAPAMSDPMSTGRVITQSELAITIPGARMTDAVFAEVSSQWLKRFYPRFRKELSRAGVSRWNDRFNCRQFTGFYVDLAQSSHSSACWDHLLPARPLALGEVWYQRDKDCGRHAVVVALTERGRIFVEPQTGQELHLSQKELASIYLAVF